FVIRAMNLLGDSLAHGLLPGIPLADGWAADVRPGALRRPLGGVAGIGPVHRRPRPPEGSGIGLLFVGMLALGVIVISRQRSYVGDLSSFLFGDILGVTPGDLRVLAVVALVVVGLVVASYRPLLALSFNAEKAASLGLR